ncbi:MAG: hypothetical protein GXP49_08115 [Deltaproteobacteria bacterium]|nr:hypothetical protein [Deltaproteobacteria bacterium]
MARKAKPNRTKQGNTRTLPAPQSEVTRQAGGVPFKEKMAELSAELYEQMAEAEELDKVIKRIYKTGIWSLIHE